MSDDYNQEAEQVQYEAAHLEEAEHTEEMEREAEETREEDQPVVEEAREDEPVREEEPVREDEPVRVEVATDMKEPTSDPPRQVSKSKSKQTSGAPSGDVPKDLNPDSAWKAICADPPSINWYLCGVDKKMDLAFDKAGQQGLEELTNILKNSSKDLLFGLLRVNSNDKGGSKRAKFIFIRFVGSAVNVMQKAKVTPKLGKIGDAFPVKHLTYDLTEDLSNFTIDSLSKEFLRVGGAHKPDSFDFGPNQVFVCK